MWDFCLVNSSQSFPVKHVSLSLSSLALSFFLCIRTRMQQIPWSMLYVSSSIRRSTNHVKICWFNKSLDEWCPSHFLFLAPLQKCRILPSCPSCRKRESGKVEEKGQREKWQRERRGEREIFLFISGCKERTSGEVRGFKGSMFAVQGSESSRGEKCGLHGIYETFQTCTFKALCDPVHTHAHKTDLAYAHTPIESFVMSSICPSINFSSVNLAHLLSLVLSEALFIIFF